MKRVTIIVLDGVGVGELPDAYKYGDVGANTLQHVYHAMHPYLPNLMELGMGNIDGLAIGGGVASPIASFGKLSEKSKGKDTTTGHWEMAGVITDIPFPTYPDGFPSEIIEAFERAIGRGSLGNYASSGTVILDELGQEHMDTGKPIVYTSADSVFQIAAHEEIIPLEELYRMCTIARGILSGVYAVGRVIARPFVGEKDAFVRTKNRRDFAIDPPHDTVLDVLKAKGFDTIGIGKIEDIFNHRGLTISNHASGNTACMAATLECMKAGFNGLMFVNLVDYDMLYGHRNDPVGFSKALEEFDNWLPSFLNEMANDDMLIITADHGCDPTYEGTDHTREYAPFLRYKKGDMAKNLGIIDGFGFVADSVLMALGIDDYTFTMR